MNNEVHQYISTYDNNFGHILNHKNSKDLLTRFSLALKLSLRYEAIKSYSKQSFT